MLITALLAAATLAGQDIGNLPPATPTYHLDGPLNFCAEEFSVRLERGETMAWIAPSPGRFEYRIRTGDIEAVVRREPSAAAPPLSTLTTMTRLRLPLSPVARRYVEAIPDRVEMDAQGNQQDGFEYYFSWLLYGAAATGRPVSVRTHWGDRDLALPYVSRIDPRPLTARRCTISRFDPALVRRIVMSPGR
jgi:hypothetical protein